MQIKLHHQVFLRTVLTLLLLLALSGAVFAASEKTDAASVYCFGSDDFVQTDSGELSGILVRSVPAAEVADICLGSRVICPGDVLSAGELDALTLVPRCQNDCEAVMTYLPISGSRIGESASLSVNLRSGKAGIPEAQDLQLETYRNLPNDGMLKATDEGSGALTFQIAEQPKLGSVTLEDGGKFIYTPQKNKVGPDCFTYTATDADGNVSAPATVKITILKPMDKATYSDMDGDEDAFEAVWLRESGLYTGACLGGTDCFCPDQTVSRGEFLVMAMQLLDIPAEEVSLSSGFADEQDAPVWMRTYISSAMRRGYVRGTASDAGLLFSPNDPVSGAAAAVILENMLSLTPPASAETLAQASSVPAWALESVQTLRRYDIPVSDADCGSPLTRAQVARLLYAVSRLLTEG